MLEQVEDILHAEFRDRLSLDGRGGEGAFLLLQVEDALLDAAGDGDFVDDDVDGLVEAVHAVDGLLFDELRIGEGWLVEFRGRGRDTVGTYGIPEGFKDDDSTRGGEVEA